MWLRHCFLTLAVHSVCRAGDLNSPIPFPLGSPQRCITNSGVRIPVFEVLAGGGWDNLRNRDMAMLMELNYSRCRTTDDGRYLIPDNLYTIPIKSSKVDTYAEMFEHWNNYTSTTASSINVHPGLSLSSFSISGKFSHGYEHVKSHQYFDKAVTTRVQVRYARYVAKLVPGSPLSAEFRLRLRQIGAHDLLNRTDSARYESQILVRDFGTHVITSVNAGAALSQVDHLQSSFVHKFESEKSTILASASASFLGLFNFGMDYSKTTSTAMMDQYLKNRTSSEVETYGGPIFQPKNYTGNSWSTSVEDDMVAVDRVGDPVFYVINRGTLPDLPVSTVISIRNYVKEAVELYYKHNAYHGCTRTDSPNFSFQANVDDGTCEPTMTNFTFGGVYQVCDSKFEQQCKNKRQKNPLTGDYSCPDGYTAIPIREYVCRVWIFWKVDCYTGYWCAASGNVSQNTGFLFGGLFTKTIPNRVTGSSTCPNEFYPLRILDDLSVCVSDDYELGTPHALPFAGFFSCKSGNPLALEKNAGLLKSTKPSLLKAFMLESGVSNYPKGCPKGYSQHLAVSDRECEVNYCIKSGALTSQGLPKVLLPPFMEMPNDEPDSTADMIIKADGSIWAATATAKGNVPRNCTTDDTKIQDSSRTENESGSSEGMSGGAVAAISIVVTLVCVGLAVVAVRVVSRRHKIQYHEEL